MGLKQAQKLCFVLGGGDHRVEATALEVAAGRRTQPPPTLAQIVVGLGDLLVYDGVVVVVVGGGGGVGGFGVGVGVAVTVAAVGRGRELRRRRGGVRNSSCHL